MLNSCAIIVTDANDLMKPIHDRMPVILEPYPVSKAVNNAKNEGRRLVERLADSQVWPGITGRS